MTRTPKWTPAQKKKWRRQWQAAMAAGRVPQWEGGTVTEPVFATLRLMIGDRTLTYWLVDSARGLPSQEQFHEFFFPKPAAKKKPRRKVSRK